MSKSTHKVEVVRVGDILPHPNADRLGIVRLFGGGYQVVVNKADWKTGDLAAYVQPDTLVPLDRPEFSWLKGQRTPKVVNGREYHLVRTVKLRKETSFGLLVPLNGIGPRVEGDDLSDVFGTLHYEPPAKESNTSKPTTYGSAAEATPEARPPYYDVEPLRRYSGAFIPGEWVFVTEKIHGANARYVCEDRGLVGFSRGRITSSLRLGRVVISLHGYTRLKVTRLSQSALDIRCGSRTQWKRPDPNDVWWRALTPQMEKFLRLNKHLTLYGEVYGDVQDLDYGLPAGEVKFIAFDLFDHVERRFLDAATFFRLTERANIPHVPILYEGKFDLDAVLSLAEGPSKLCADNLGCADPRCAGDTIHVREGVVVRPIFERHDPRVGRVVLKAVGEGYYSR